MPLYLQVINIVFVTIFGPAIVWAVISIVRLQTQVASILTTCERRSAWLESVCAVVRTNARNLVRIGSKLDVVLEDPE